jgi:hypothetical protein|tara:strand:- start:172 stop:678 length:507 start_codon:yes stop_codon:yes gene_type:complete
MSSILKVSEIQDPTNGNSALTVDSSGQVVLPQNKVAFQAQRSGSLTGYDGQAVANAIVFNNEIYDIGGNYNPTTGLFTAPVDGMYTFYGTVYADAVVLQLWPLLNNARIASIGINTAAAGGGVTLGSAVIKMDANDTLGLKAYTASSSRTIYENALHTVFTGCLTLPL